MRDLSRRRVARVLILAGLVVTCGKKGPPLPPVPRFPVEADPPLARQVGERLEIRIPLPTRAANGDAVEQFTGLKLYRIERPLTASGAPPLVRSWDFPDSLRPFRTIEGEEAARLTPGGVLVHEEVVPPVGRQPPRAYAYAVRFRGRGRGWSPPFTAAVVVPSDGLPAPALFTTAGELEGVRLSWQAVDGPVAVFRGQAGGPVGFLPLKVVEAGTGTYLDRLAEPGATYDYVVRAVSGNLAGHAYGTAAGPVRVAVIDSFPPAPPRDLAALARIGGVDLFWQPGDETDLAGYRIWRRELPDGEWTIMTAEPLTRTNWSDFAVVEGSSYFYAVTAVDDAQPRNESARSGAERVSVPYAPRSRPEEPR